MSMNDKWGHVPLDPGADRRIQLGELTIHVKRTERELWVQTVRGSEHDTDPVGEWSRWAMPPSAEVYSVPAVPDRLAVVSYEYPFNLPPRGRARVYVRIPLHVRILTKVSGEAELTVADVPTVVLSDTWWGSFTDGELAYWIGTKARAEVSSDLFESHLAMCPFELVNQSSEALPIERFAVRVPHLTLFASGEQLWTDEVSVRYQAVAEGSEIQLGQKPPRECLDGRRVAEPREPPPRGFRALTFDKLRSMSGIGS